MRAEDIEEYCLPPALLGHRWNILLVYYGRG